MLYYLKMDEKLQLLLEASDKFIRVVNKLSALEKARFDFGTDQTLTPSEIHTVVAIAKNQNMNVTELAAHLGITKGAVSQMLNKIEKKGLIQRKKKGDNAREINLILTKDGQKAYEGHEQFHYDLYVEFIRSFSIEEFAMLAQVTDKLDFFVDYYLKKGS